MASIVKRKNKYAVVYSYVDETGKKRQHWETYSSHAEAKKRKVQIEYEKSNKTLIVPSVKTVGDLLDDYVSLYGIHKWAISTYDSKKALITNYIRPYIGDVKLCDVTPRMMDKYYQSLLTVKAKPRPFHPDDNGCVTARTVKEIHKLLRSAFNQAVRWDLIAKNPVANANLPKCDDRTREIWDSATVIRALELCEDPLLKLAINLSFACSLRMGELLGLTWDCVDVSEGKIKSDGAYIFVNKELQRVSKESLAVVGETDVFFKFPPIFAKTSTVLVLKAPKTKTSVRKVYLPRSVAEMLAERKKHIEEVKVFLGDEYHDYNLVMCGNDGRPIEGQRINNGMKKLIEEHGLPPVVFHSLRHTSTTYKLKLSGGDIKAVQGDTGHAQATMVTERYAHIMDDDRKQNARRFEEAFYSHTEDQSVHEAAPAPTPPSDDTLELLGKLQQSPELMALLRALTANLPT